LSDLFDFYDDAISSRPGIPVGALQRDGDRARESLEAWLGSVARRPSLALLHIFEPHAPYDPPEPFASRYRSNPYDGEIAAADAIVGRFIETLKARDSYDKALIILLSDHGEGLGDHGEPEHGVFLYRESIHVPLVVKLPGSERRGETVERPVGLIDIAPTVLLALGLTPPPTMIGEDLLGTENRESASRRISARRFPSHSPRMERTPVSGRRAVSLHRGTGSRVVRHVLRPGRNPKSVE
jgi:arylsulfatase A-like enzyme